MLSIARIVVAACVTAAMTSFAAAQQTTSTSETKNFEVIAVSGNELVVRLPEGTRELTVPDDFRFMVNGQPVSVRELRPGMKGTAVITTRTTMTPVTATEIKDGTVAAVSGSTIIVRTAEGVRSFSQSEIDKRGVKIHRDGKPAQLSEFRAGDRLSATIITAQPPRVVTERDVQAAISAAGAQPAPPPQAARAPTPAPASPQSTGTAGSQSSSPPARTLPSTGSLLPLSGLAGLASLALGATLAMRRRRLGR